MRHRLIHFHLAGEAKYLEEEEPHLCARVHGYCHLLGVGFLPLDLHLQLSFKEYAVDYLADRRVTFTLGPPRVRQPTINLKVRYVSVWTYLMLRFSIDLLVGPSAGHFVFVLRHRHELQLVRKPVTALRPFLGFPAQYDSVILGFVVAKLNQLPEVNSKHVIQLHVAVLIGPPCA